MTLLKLLIDREFCGFYRDFLTFWPRQIYSLGCKLTYHMD